MKINKDLVIDGNNKLSDLLTSRFDLIYSGTKLIPNEYNTTTSFTITKNPLDYDFLIIEIAANPSQHTGQWVLMRPTKSGCTVVSSQFYFEASYILIVTVKYDGNKTFQIHNRKNDFPNQAGIAAIWGIRFNDINR